MTTIFILVSSVNIFSISDLISANCWYLCTISPFKSVHFHPWNSPLGCPLLWIHCFCFFGSRVHNYLWLQNWATVKHWYTDHVKICLNCLVPHWDGWMNFCPRDWLESLYGTKIIYHSCHVFFMRLGHKYIHFDILWN